MGVLLLDSINQPADLKQLNEKQVEQLCEAVSYTHLTLPTT